MRLFTYGTLQNPWIQSELWGTQMEGSPATLENFKRTGLMSIVDAQGETVDGRVYDLSPQQLRRTDWYEGSGYDRRTVTVDGQPTLVYVPNTTRYEMYQ